MAKIALLLPSDRILKAALELAAKYHLDICYTAITSYADLKKLGEEAGQAGAEIIISRGGHAQEIKKRTDIPVIEIHLTGVEIGRLIVRAKRLAGKERPSVALIGPENMFVNVNSSTYSQLHEVRFSTYLVSGADQLAVYAAQAVEDGADVLIGGPVVSEYAAKHGILSVATDSGEESLEGSYRIARLMGDAIDQSKKYAANLNAILDYASSGIIQIDVDGTVLHMNRFVLRLLDTYLYEIGVTKIWEIIPQLNPSFLTPVLSGSRNMDSVFIRINRVEFIVSISPVPDEQGMVVGAIIDFHEGRQLDLYEQEKRARLIKEGYVARHVLNGMVARSPKSRETLEMAGKYAGFSDPVLIIGESGTEKRAWAECIHNGGLFHDLAFIALDLSAFSEEELERTLFGQKETARQQGGGEIGYLQSPCTLYLENPSCLSGKLQSMLLRFLRSQTEQPYSLEERKGAVRLMFGESRDLLKLVQQGSFSRDLYYQISVMRLFVSPLRERKEDIDGLAEHYMKEFQQIYKRYLHLTDDAWKFLRRYEWPGNHSELRNVLHRLFVTSPQRSIDKRTLMMNMDWNGEKTLVLEQELAVKTDFKALQVTQALQKHKGNRAAAAGELGISTSTLWRLMKKYAVPKNTGKELERK